MMAPEARIRVGLVGAGAVAPHHLDALRALPEPPAIGLVDLDAARAGALARRHPGTTVFPSLAAMCDAGARVVHVLTPPESHVAVALDAVERGCDVLVEKPLATSGADCARLAAAAAHHGRRVGVNHSLLHDPYVRRVLDAARAGAIGAPVSAEYACAAVYPPWDGGPPPPHYRAGGHPFRDLGVHGLYLLRACLGEIAGLHVERWSHGGDPNLAFDEWDVRVRCARGTGRIRLSWSVRPSTTTFTIDGERGSLRADVAHMLISRRRARGLPGSVERAATILGDAAPLVAALPRHGARLLTGRLRGYAGLRASVAAFHEALRTGGPLPASLEDGAAVVRWVEEAAAPADAAVRRRAAARPRPHGRPPVVVTGAGGRLGGALVRRLVADGTSVRALVRRTAAAEQLERAGIEVAIGDLGDADAVSAAVQGAEVVYHAAAAMHGGRAEHVRGTVAGTRHVVDACLAQGVRRLVHVSSLSVLDWGGLEASGHPVTEEGRLEPLPEERGLYTQAKLAAERLVLDAVHERGLDAVVVRPGLVDYGEPPGPSTVDGIRLGRWLLVLADADAPLPLVAVEDVVDGLVRAAASAPARGRVFHLVGESRETRRSIGRRAAEAGGMRLVCLGPSAIAALGRAGELAGRVLRIAPPVSRYRLRAAGAWLHFDCSLARRELGWRPRTGELTRDAAAGPGNACATAQPAPAPDTPAPWRSRDAGPAAEAP